jgi:hypothetical protein
MRKVDGYSNYDQSQFNEQTEIASTDEEKLAIVSKQYKLSEFTDRKNFKSYDELKKKLEMVLSGESAPVKSAAAISEEEDMPVATAPRMPSKSAPQPRVAATTADEEDDLSYFQKLANE